MPLYKEIDRCRICGSKNLLPVLSLGDQSLTGVFPKTKDQRVTSGPLELIRCDESQGRDACGLVQLRHSYNKDEMYGSNYGYRSGLNRSMALHLQDMVRRILQLVALQPGDLVLDIGSNDATLLKAYPSAGPVLVGIDPTGAHFKKYYPEHVRLIPDFFSREIFQKNFGEKKAKVVTSIAMFYDLESPLDFMRQIRDILADDGVWVLEQSYLPMMMEMNAYDTICHEHLEYYSLKQIHWMTQRLGLKIVDMELNDANGGSFKVTIAKSDSPIPENSARIREAFQQEAALSGPGPYDAFKKRVFNCREELNGFVAKAKKEKKKILGYGASTKGNVILQFCGLTADDIPFIGEVNEEKFSCFTPGTLIPIISESQARSMRPDYLLVLPWHFRDFIVEKEAAYRASGGRLVFPLPSLALV